MFDPDSLDNINRDLLDKVYQFVERVVIPYHRAEVRGLDRIPRGPALYVGNHSGATLSIDTFIWCSEARRVHGMDSFPHGLAHDLIMDIPILNHIVCQLGGLRASPENARRAFEAGRKIVVYPGGDMEAYRPYRERNEVTFAGRTGFARIAIENNVPIIPVVAHGAHGTLLILHDFEGLAKKLKLRERMRYGRLPVSFVLPYGFWLGPMPPYLPLPSRITIEMLEPIEVDGGPEAAADPAYVESVAVRVEQTIQTALRRLAYELEG
jgi:1-acyl-sn-glycerol-3-phosphate acyltransferase